VTGFVPGDAVLADLFGTFGGFADQVVGPAKLWVKRVTGIDPVVAATLPQSGTIALTGVGDRVRAGMRVLINGAGGGSGPLALQMAKAAGAEVWVVDNAAKLDVLRRLGADRVIDYRAEDFALLPERFDLVLDLFGTRSARRVRRVLAPGGRYMFVGGPVPVLLNLVIVGAILALGSDRKAGLLIVEQGPRRLEELMTMVADGRLRPVVGEVAPLAEAAKALGRMGRGDIAGKLVVVP